MSPVFWRRVSKKTFVFWSLLLILNTQANASFIQILESLSEIDQSILKNLAKNTAVTINSKSDLDKYQNLRLDPAYIRSILFHSSRESIALIPFNRCHLYSLIDKSLLTSRHLPARHVLIQMDLINPLPDKPVTVQAIVSIDDVFDRLLSSDCYALKDIRTIFSPEKIKDNAKRFIPILPNTLDQCKTDYDRWMRMIEAPLICNVARLYQDANRADKLLNNNTKISSSKREKLATVRSYKFSIEKYFDTTTLTYFEKICDSKGNANTFCPQYLNKNYWRSIYNAKQELFNLEIRCKSILKKDSLASSDFENCIDILTSQKELCRSTPLKEFQSLAPYYTCDVAQEVLKNATLRNNYFDCPGLIYDEGITNFSRIFAYFKKVPWQSTQLHCATQALVHFSESIFALRHDGIWNNFLCYKDPIQAQKVCLPTLKITHPTSNMSRDKVVTKIISKLRPVEENFTCKMVSDTTFNPMLLNFKQGCYIVYNEKTCNATTCPSQVIYNNQEFSDFTEQSSISYEYFPHSVARQKYSLSSIIDDDLKTTSKKILNYTELTQTLSRRGSIVHGIGCAESLLPHFFPPNGINSCSPLPFIIDGIQNYEGEELVRLIASTDTVQNARLVSWAFVFQSVKQYQVFQGLKMWTLYALSK